MFQTFLSNHVGNVNKDEPSWFLHVPSWMNYQSSQTLRNKTKTTSKKQSFRQKWKEQPFNQKMNLSTISPGSTLCHENIYSRFLSCCPPHSFLICRPAPHCSPCTPHWRTRICLVHLDIAMSKPLVIMTNLRGVSYLSTVVIKVEKSRMIVSQKHLETLSQFMMHLFVFTSKPAKFPAERWKVFFLKRPKFDLPPGMVETSYEVWIPTVFINSKP